MIFFISLFWYSVIVVLWGEKLQRAYRFIKYRCIFHYASLTVYYIGEVRNRFKCYLYLSESDRCMFKQFILVHFSYKNIQRVFRRNIYKIFNYFLVVKKKKKKEMYKFSMKNRSIRNVIVLLSNRYTTILLHCKFSFIFFILLSFLTLLLYILFFVFF